jgi:hypothetical protein
MFCGEGVCGAHSSRGRFVGGWRTTGQRSWGAFPATAEDYFVVPRALWCGRCEIEVHQK